MSEVATKGWSRIVVTAWLTSLAATALARNASVSVPGVQAPSTGRSPIVPQLPSDLQLPALPGQALPDAGRHAAASYPRAVPPAPVNPLAARASLHALGPTATPDRPQEGSQPLAALAPQTQVYDGAKAAKAADSAQPAPVAAYTAAPAEIPLGRLSPSWRQASGPSASAKPIPARKPGKTGPIDVGAEENFSAQEDIKRVTGTSPAAVSRKDSSYFDARVFDVAGARQIGLRGTDLLWIDGEGKLNVYDADERRTNKYTAPMGPVERFAVAEDGTLYVAAGNTIQRWDIESGEAVVILDHRFETAAGVELTAGASGLEISLPSGYRWSWQDGRMIQRSAPAETIAPEPLLSAGRAAAWKPDGDSTSLWKPGVGNWTQSGSIPVRAEALAASKDGATVYLLSGEALYQWDVDGRRYRQIDVPDLGAAAVAPRSVQTTADGRHVLVTAGERVFLIDTQKQSSDVSGPEGRVRLWSEQNPMYVKDGALHIGDFAFPIAKRYAKDDRTKLRKLLDRVLRRPYVPAELPLAISEKNWKALNLPSNKFNLYQTLRSFSLGQHVMYVGETGGGKTWMADMVAQITNNELWMVSLTEYTRNQDLIARDTFGEEGKNRTGLSMSVVLKWLQNGGVLLLDEMHKPLEGIAALNNILQNLEYRMPDGRVIKGDPKKSFVIGTMNPVKPPYKGEPPSGELESRFGTKLRVNYLPPAEEAALLEIFKPALGSKMAQTIVRIAGELRKSYPDVLPLPISSRTLLHIVQEIAAYPHDDPVEIFKVKYNPMALLDDPSIGHAIDKALQAHDLRGAASTGAEKKSPLKP